eukprot:scaffold148861_cov28-Tisochrysis_lutea.AAC.6
MCAQATQSGSHKAIPSTHACSPLQLGRSQPLVKAVLLSSRASRFQSPRRPTSLPVLALTHPLHLDRDISLEAKGPRHGKRLIPIRLASCSGIAPRARWAADARESKRNEAVVLGEKYLYARAVQHKLAMGKKAVHSARRNLFTSRGCERGNCCPRKTAARYTDEWRLSCHSADPRLPDREAHAG